MKPAERLLARRYAKALLETAGKGDARARLSQDLAHAVRLLRDLDARLKNPMVPAAEKGRAIAAAFGRQVSDQTKVFVELLVKKKRYALLPLIAQELEALADKDQGLTRAYVKTAAPLNEAEMSALIKRLEKFFGGKVQIDVKEDPALIGGVVVRAGDWVMDSSVARHLQRLKEAISA